MLNNINFRVLEMNTRTNNSVLTQNVVLINPISRFVKIINKHINSFDFIFNKVNSLYHIVLNLKTDYALYSFLTRY